MQFRFDRKRVELGGVGGVGLEDFHHLADVGVGLHVHPGVVVVEEKERLW